MSTHQTNGTAEFKTGDKVRLRSGGLGMMVDFLGTPVGSDGVPCVWFDETGTFLSRTFSPEVLEIDDRMTAAEWAASESGRAFLSGIGRSDELPA